MCCAPLGVRCGVYVRVSNSSWSNVIAVLLGQARKVVAGTPSRPGMRPRMPDGVSQSVVRIVRKCCATKPLLRSVLICAALLAKQRSRVPLGLHETFVLSVAAFCHLCFVCSPTFAEIALQFEAIESTLSRRQLGSSIPLSLDVIGTAASMGGPALAGTDISERKVEVRAEAKPAERRPPSLPPKPPRLKKMPGAPASLL